MTFVYPADMNANSNSSQDYIPAAIDPQTVSVDVSADSADIDLVHSETELIIDSTVINVNAFLRNKLVPKSTERNDFSS